MHRRLRRAARHVATACLVAALTAGALAQDRLPRCGTAEALSTQDEASGTAFVERAAARDTVLRTALSLARRRGQPRVRVIPVVVHVLHTAATPEQNVSDEQIAWQIAELCSDFRRTADTPGHNTHPAGADVEIEFRLAAFDPDGKRTSGITRTLTTVKTFRHKDPDFPIAYSAKGGKDVWDTSRYLNVWVAALDVAGWAFLPGVSGADRDAVAIDYRSFGNAAGTAVPPQHLGRTLTHEVGHWLGLDHLWGPRTGCDVDDGIADTPPQHGPTPDNPTPGHSCNSADQIENYLDYSDDDVMNLFTRGQRVVMDATLRIYRPGVLDGSALATEEFELILRSAGSPDRVLVGMGYDDRATVSADPRLGERRIPAKRGTTGLDARLLLPGGGAVLRDLRPAGTGETASWKLQATPPDAQPQKPTLMSLNWEPRRLPAGEWTIQAGGQSVQMRDVARIAFDAADAVLVEVTHQPPVSPQEATALYTRIAEQQAQLVQQETLIAQQESSIAQMKESLATLKAQIEALQDD